MSMAVKVSKQIPDISPTLTLRQDKAYTTYPANRKRYALPSMEVIREIEPDYAWTRLPNMAAYKTAIVRNKVCGGLMYLLPGNKTNSSLARPYTTELGAMFSEPYTNFKPKEYNEENVKQSSGIHFSPNTYITRLSKHRSIKRHPQSLNLESRQSYNGYKTLVSKKNEAAALESGGKGNLPVAVKLGEAEIELQNEVQGILDEVDVQGVVEGEHEERPTPPYSSPTNHRISAISSPKHAVANDDSQSPQPLAASKEPRAPVRDFRQHHYQKKAIKFKDYKELRSAEVPRPQLPERFKSPYLSHRKSKEIWQWLNVDFSKSKFEHFMDVCS
ncbi:uncharacterized protein [Watersipora subatra]|uniref:uncharacterized protein n=1 Tax=Watersipora subatra TaxID=2589382 RepID=UPI00355B24A9